MFSYKIYLNVLRIQDILLAIVDAHSRIQTSFSLKHSLSGYHRQVLGFCLLVTIFCRTNGSLSALFMPHAISYPFETLSLVSRTVIIVGRSNRYSTSGRVAWQSGIAHTSS